MKHLSQKTYNTLGSDYMKKDRNSFFSQFGSYGYQTQPQMSSNMMMPNMATNMPQQYSNTNNVYDDIDARLSKIERELSRLDQRISNLENNLTNIPSTTQNQTDFNFANSMYMV